MEHIRCIFCQRDKGNIIIANGSATVDDIVIRENGFLARKCPSCHLIYVSPRPTQEEVNNLYEDGEADILPEDHIDALFLKRLYAKNNLAILKPFRKAGSLLEIGAGAGAFLDEARRQGFDVYGIELNKLQADYIKDALNIPCETESIANAFGERQFDVIYHCDVISHFHDPWQEFSAINRKLAHNGYMLFETGNSDVELKYYKEIEKFQLPDHLFFFNQRNINDLLEGTGFELRQVVKYCTLPQHRTGRRLNTFVRTLFGKRAHQKTVTALLEKIESTSTINQTPSEAVRTNKAVSHSIMGMIKRYARRAWHIWTYILRYKIGYFTLKQGRPQTMVFVAQKVKGIPEKVNKKDYQSAVSTN